MKRKIAILLAAVMTTAMLPMNVMADSSNSVNKKVTVKDEDPIGSVWVDKNSKKEVATSGDSYAPVKLKIIPKNGVESDSRIFIKIENGEFDPDVFEMPEYVSPTGTSYAQVKSDVADLGEEVGLNTHLGNYGAELPYEIVSVSKREIEVKLFPISEKYCDRATNEIGNDKLYYNIPIHALADGTGDVKITVDDNETLVSGGGSYVIATSSDEDGSTTATIDDVTNFNDPKSIEDITIKENIKGTFEGGKTITARVSGGFKISAGDKFKVTLDGEEVAYNFSEDSEKLYIDIPAGYESDAAARVRISDLVVAADDEDDDWGDVNITFSGAGITKETLHVATRVDYGFKMSAVDSATTIIAGRSYLEDTANLEEDDFETAAFKFEETNENSVITNRKMKFTVPEGVKIMKYEFDNCKVVSAGTLEDLAEITDDGTTLTINKGLEGNGKDCIEFECKFYVSCDPDFTGDVTVSVSGAAVAESEELESVAVANVITPIKVDSNITKANMGYQAVSTADITITEAEAGVLLDDKKVVIAIDSLYGSKELGFADDGIDYDVEGELKIKSFDVDEGEISFTIDKDSYNEPSSITIKNVKVGSTRSVPYGNYDLKVMGSAVINNYVDNVDDVYPNKGVDDNSLSKDDKAMLGLFDENSGYKFKDYLQIVTETGTLDKVVKVTIGESTITMDDEAVTMDVAPYIQVSSNSTMVPLRFVSLAIGVDSDNVATADESSKVMWDANTKTATILYAAGNGQKIIQFTAGSNTMVIDGTAVPMENGVVAEISNDRMFVPFRALGQALGVPVTWDAETRTAIYNQK